MRAALFLPALALLGAAFAPAPAAADEIPVVCPACDVEAPPPGYVCPKCGRTLPPPPPPDAEPDGDTGATPESAPAPAEPAVSPLLSALKADARLAAAAATPPALALAAARNALALAAAAPAGAVRPEDRKRLVARETACLAALATEAAPCPECHGVGHVAAPKPPAPKRGGKGGYISIEQNSVAALNARGATRTCTFCGGLGKARRAVDRKRLAGLVGLGARDFAVRARAEGREEAGGVWVPAGAAAAGSAAARREPEGCDACAGTGTRPCRACGGFGRVRCPNRAFHAAPAAAGEGADRKAIESTLQTPAGAAPCPTCGGPRAEPRPAACSECAGKGIAVCPACDGAGRPPRK